MQPLGWTTVIPLDGVTTERQPTQGWNQMNHELVPVRIPQRPLHGETDLLLICPQQQTTKTVQSEGAAWQGVNSTTHSVCQVHNQRPLSRGFHNALWKWIPPHPCNSHVIICTIILPPRFLRWISTENYVVRPITFCFSRNRSPEPRGEGAMTL